MIDGGDAAIPPLKVVDPVEPERRGEHEDPSRWTSGSPNHRLLHTVVDRRADVNGFDHKEGISYARPDANRRILDSDCVSAKADQLRASRGSRRRYPRE